MSKLAIRVLGPIDAELDGGRLPFSKARHREILGLLVAAHGKTVSTARLIEELWEDGPAGAVGAIRTFIGEIRRILEPERRARTPSTILVTTGNGYALKPESITVDLRRAEQGIRAAEGVVNPETCESLLTAALEEWCGHAFEEFSARAWAKNERAWIAELRAGAVDHLAETQLEGAIMRRDPSLDIDDGGQSILVRTANATARTGTRSQFETVTLLLPLLAVSGSVQIAAEQRMSSITAAEQFGDPELAARVIGGFEVPGSWTRSDDAVQSVLIVEAALRTISALPAEASDRLRARLLATVAMESRGKQVHERRLVQRSLL